MKLKALAAALAFSCVATVAVAKPWTWRFAYNYCTLSYTFAFYGEREWTREIASLAANGYNAAPVEAGLAKVWQLTLREVGASDAQVAAFLPDTAARAWWCMGNLEGLGGPLPQAEIDRDAKLGRHIAKTMRVRGIEPVFQGFTGLVPHDFADYGAKGAKVVDQGNWCGFRRPSVLDPTSPRFAEVAKVWYRNLEKVYGVKPRLFGGDLFHEGGRTDGIDVAASARAVQREMVAAGGKDSVWFLQSWQTNPSDKLLSGLADANTVVLVLRLDMTPEGNAPENLRDFGTKPWVWCEVSNFGGKAGLYGGIPLLCDFARVVDSPKAKHLVGMGMLSEGLGLNPLWYAFFAEVMGRGDGVRKIERAELERWIAAYAKGRYGSDSPKFREALTLLVDSVYSPTGKQEGPSENVLCAKPAWQIDRATTWGSTHRYWDPAAVRRAADLFDAAIAETKAQKRTREQAHNLDFDRADFRRQVLQDELTDLLKQAKDSPAAREKFLANVRETDAVLSKVPEFTYGYWEAQADRFGGARAKAALKRMVTDWSGRPDVLDDYSQRQWSGLVNDFYLPRWEAFFKASCP